MPIPSDCAIMHTKLLSANTGIPFVRFRTDNMPLESATRLPNCYHFGLNGTTIRSPNIPILVDGIVIPVVIDTGAEVSMLSDEAMRLLFPEGYWARHNRKVKSLGDTLISVQGPLRLSVEVCTLPLVHEFYHLDGMEQSLLGFDLFQAAALVIDCELGCVWSSSVVKNGPHLTKIPKYLADVTTSEASTQTSFSPSDEDESMDQTLIKRVPWSEHAVELPTDPEKIKRMIESIAIVADASAHAYGTHEGPDISEVIDFNDDVLPDIPSDGLLAYCSFETSNGDDISTLHCVESVDTLPSSIPEVELPEHLQVLFLQTVDNKELSQEAEDGLKQLLLDHQNTFAKSKTDIGLCTVVQHDIDTGDTKPIKQSPR